MDTIEIERCAAHQQPIPDHLDLPETALYYAFFGLYRGWRSGTISKDEARIQKAKILKKYSELSDRCEKKNLLGKQVKYQGGAYTMTAYILRYTPHGLIHAAELLDENRNCVVEARLEDIN